MTHACLCFRQPYRAVTCNCIIIVVNTDRGKYLPRVAALTRPLGGKSRLGNRGDHLEASTLARARFYLPPKLENCAIPVLT